MIIFANKIFCKFEKNVQSFKKFVLWKEIWQLLTAHKPFYHGTGVLFSVVYSILISSCSRQTPFHGPAVSNRRLGRQPCTAEPTTRGETAYVPGVIRGELRGSSSAGLGRRALLFGAAEDRGTCIITRQTGNKKRWSTLRSPRPSYFQRRCQCYRQNFSIVEISKKKVWN